MTGAFEVDAAVPPTSDRVTAGIIYHFSGLDVPGPVVARY